MSLETTTSSETLEDTGATETSANSGYSMTDPGYSEAESTIDDVVNELESFKASKQNDETTPSETLDDASETVGDTEETVTTPTDDAAVSDEISDELIDRALDLGYSAEDLKAFSDAKALQNDMARVERINRRLQQRKSAGEQDKPAEDTTPEPDWEALIELGHDPDIIKLQKQSWEETKAAKEQVRQLLQAEQQRAFEAQCNRFDETLNKIEGFDALLGKGLRGNLSRDLVANRQKVFTKMQALRQGYELAGEAVPPEADLIQEAVHASFYKHAQQTARAQLKGEIKRAGSQALSRPRSTGGKPLSGPDRALAAEAEFWKKHE